MIEWVKSLSLVRLFVTPWTRAHQAPPSMEFSRQAYWSGLPFPSPMRESEKWKWNHSVVSDSWRPHGLRPTRLLHPWNFPGKSTGVGCHCLLQREYYKIVYLKKLLLLCCTLVAGGLICGYFIEKNKCPLNPVDLLSINFECSTDGTAAQLGTRDVKYSCPTP